MRVVIADDEELVRYSVRDMLGEVTVPVTVVGEAENGVRLVELCRTLRPDLAFVDVRMPKMSGLEAIESLREEFPETEWIILTSYPEFDYARRALSAGAVGYLLKPVGPEELENALHRVADRSLQRVRVENARFQNRIGALLDGAADEEPDPASWRYAAALIVIDSRHNQPVAQESHHEGVKSVKNEVEELTGPRARIGLAAVSGGALVCVLAWDTKLAEPGAGESLKERYLRRLARAAQQFRTPGRRMTIVCSRAISSASEILPKVEHLKRLAAFRPLAGFGEAVRVEEIEPYLQSWQAGELSSRLLAAAEAFRAGHWLACERSLREASELTRTHRELQHSAVQAAVTRFLSTVLSERIGPLSSLDSWLPGLIDGAAREHRSEPGETAGRATIDEVQRYLEENFMNEVSVAEVANSLGLTPNYLSALFHKRVGITFTRYLTRLRMDKARALLVTGQHGVAEVAAMVGYGSPRHFARTFKATFQRYPSDLKP